MTSKKGGYRQVFSFQYSSRVLFFTSNRAKKYHSEAYQMLSSVTQGNLHYDTPIYLMNIGSVYQKIGRRENANGCWRTANENLQQVLLSLLQPANEVWGNVMFSQVFVSPRWGGGAVLGRGSRS